MDNMSFLLSSGVVVAIITGIFSVVVSLISSSRVSNLERQREAVNIKLSRLTRFQDAYTEICSIESPQSILSAAPHDRPVSSEETSELLQRCVQSCKKYDEVMKRLKPYFDETLYSEWMGHVSEHNSCMDSTREVIRTRGSASPDAITDSVIHLQRSCEDILSRQIRLLSDFS